MDTAALYVRENPNPPKSPNISKWGCLVVISLVLGWGDSEKSLPRGWIPQNVVETGGFSAKCICISDAFFCWNGPLASRPENGMKLQESEIAIQYLVEAKRPKFVKVCNVWFEIQRVSLILDRCLDDTRPFSILCPISAGNYRILGLGVFFLCFPSHPDEFLM